MLVTALIIAGLETSTQVEGAVAQRRAAELLLLLKAGGLVLLLPSWSELPKCWEQTSCLDTCANTTLSWTRVSRTCWDSKTSPHINLPACDLHNMGCVPV